MEFKVGDRVKYGGCTTGTIVETSAGCRGDNLLFLADEGQGFSGHNGLNYCKGKYTGNRCFYPFTGLLELLSPQHSITITSDGHKTTAEYNGKSAIAKCNPSDTFDIFKGAKLALERLEAVENLKPHLEWQGESYGILGASTKIKDELGILLKIGDVTTVYDKLNQSNLGDGVVVNDGTMDYISGIYSSCRCNGTIDSNWLIIKKQSYTEVTKNKVDGYLYVRTPRLS